ncbi:hypothetical protein K1T71_012499 [Dendrolimus kikuchii]|uniref:Uncharacterized protein n=1 Tax=Dendrolimus kikuchii TaxID=765133 RepID=A0ACC1CJI5_9NEOP|nr:hypothetical protein K1T71_012499 [Dendrolimus kikuchii]
MGLNCSCEEPCNHNSWAHIKTRLMESAQRRRQATRGCICVRQRPKCLRIRRKKHFALNDKGCTCEDHGCCHENTDGNRQVRNLCRFTVDAYFN